MFVAASTHGLADKSFADACALLTELDYDKVELWLDEHDSHLQPSEIANDAEGFVARFREMTRLTPIGLCLAHDVDVETFSGVSKAAKLLRVTQITVPASPLGTPFNAEIDRLRAFLAVAGQDGVRLSIKTQTGQLTEDPHTAVELCQSLDGLGLTLDPSYYVCGAHGSVSFGQVYPYVYHVHLRDSSLEQVQVQVGLGEIDYSRLIGQLRRQNYTRALSVEMLPDQSNGVDRSLEMRKLRMLLETLL